MQDIASRAGVVPSVLYDHFGSKRELHITLLDLHDQQMRDRTLRRLEGASAEELPVPASPVISSSSRRTRSSGGSCTGIPGGPGDRRCLPKDRRSGYRRHRRLHPVRRAGRQTGQGHHLDEAAWILARATQSASHGVATWWYENRDVPRERVVELVFMLLWQGFDGMLKLGSAD